MFGAVPEPSAVLALAAVGLGVLARRRVVEVVQFEPPQREG
jgi:hypothetical protein